MDAPCDATPRRSGGGLTRAGQKGWVLRVCWGGEGRGGRECGFWRPVFGQAKHRGGGNAFEEAGEVTPKLGPGEPQNSRLAALLHN